MDKIITSYQTIEDEKYNVYCEGCDNTFQPPPRTPMWWLAKQKADKGHLDALVVRNCGCRQNPTVELPTAPYRVLGFTWDGTSYDIPCMTFTELVKTARAHRTDLPIIVGVSSRRVENILSGL